ncbi:hypothetical protein QAD02_020586, partial [Eretmocerus hayati]
MVLKLESPHFHSNYGSFHESSTNQSILHGTSREEIYETSDKMTQPSDIYQRQPLLPTTSIKSKERWNCDDPTSYYEADTGSKINCTNLILQHDTSSESDEGVVRIDIPVPQREEIRYPREKWKTFLAYTFMCLNFILTTTSLAIVHDRVPDRDVYGPLPDIVLDNVREQSWTLNVSEILIVMVSMTAVAFVLVHKH